MWSLGVIIYILLCGYPPFYSEHPSSRRAIDRSMRRKIMNGVYNFPEREWARVSERAKDVVTRWVDGRYQRPAAVCASATLCACADVTLEVCFEQCTDFCASTPTSEWPLKSWFVIRGLQRRCPIPCCSHQCIWPTKYVWSLVCFVQWYPVCCLLTAKPLRLSAWFCNSALPYGVYRSLPDVPSHDILIFVLTTSGSLGLEWAKLAWLWISILCRIVQESPLYHATILVKVELPKSSCFFRKILLKKLNRFIQTSC